MSTYLKNMSGYKHNQLKSKSYDEIQEMFDKEMKRVNHFVDMNTELVKSSEIRTEGSSKKAGDELESDNSKKQKIDEHFNLFWKAAKATYLAKIEKVITKIKDISKEAHKHLMERNPEIWSRTYLRTYRACDAVENGIRTRKWCQVGSASAGVNTLTMSARGGTRSGKGGKKFSVSSRDGKKDAIEVSTPSSSTVGFEMSTSSVSAGVRVTESGVRLRGGSYIR
ncbi:hypothetical protein Tco_1450437, partial [Tanacetum coccineum]